MNTQYDLIPRRKTNKIAYALLVTISIFIFLSFIINLLVFMEFYYFLDFLKNSHQIKNLTSALSHINFDSVIEIFKEVKTNDIKNILGKITESDVENFFLSLDNCIVDKCDVIYH